MKAKVFDSYYYAQTGTIIEATNQGRVTIKWPNGDVGIYDAKKVVIVRDNESQLETGEMVVVNEKENG